MNKREREIDEIAETLAALRSVLKSRSSILRRVAESRLYSILALALGSAIGLFGIFAHFASNDAGSNPSRIGSWALAFFALFLSLGGSAKIHFSRKLTKSIDPDGFAALIKAIYGGKATSILVSAAISIAVGIAFLASKGLYGYIVPLISIFIAFAAHARPLDQQKVGRRTGQDALHWDTGPVAENPGQDPDCGLGKAWIAGLCRDGEGGAGGHGGGNP